ncbi:MAG: DUF1850 domain-containing protein [Caldisericia bacterium]|nr:DUF1850 domain-containing protein [Caldisericia bacterium]
MKLKSALLILVLLIVGIYFSFYKFHKNLLIVDAKTGKTLLSFNVEDKDTFEISFIHSVSLSPVYEYYRIEDGDIVLYETDFSYSSAGLPTETEGEEKLIMEKDKFKLVNMNRPFKEINYGIVKEWNFKLYIKGKEYNLSKMFGTRRVIITLRR